jgi:hypothetical protein
VFEAPQADEIQVSLGDLPTPRFAQLQWFQDQRHVIDQRQPRQQPVFLEHDADAMRMRSADWRLSRLPLP